MERTNILLVQDSQTQGNGTKRHLEDRGHKVVLAGSGLTALLAARNEEIELILLDVALPDIEGLDLCRRFRARHETHAMPIILLTRRGYTPDLTGGTAYGPDDYLEKPFTVDELDSRIAGVLASRQGAHNPVPEASDSISLQEPEKPVVTPTPKEESREPDLRRVLPERQQPAVLKLDAARKQSLFPFPDLGDIVVDPATGLFSRRQFEAMFSKEFKKALRFKQQMSCMLIDLECRNAKQLADEGLIKAIIGLVQSTIREVDTAAWWTGEAFIVMLPNTMRNDALQAAARILESVASHSLGGSDSSTVTMNIGVAGLPDKDIDSEKKMIEAACASCRRARELMRPSPDHALFLRRRVAAVRA